MALFGRSDKEKEAGGSSDAPPPRPVMGREGYCRICNKRVMFTRCWQRPRPLAKCEACGAPFDNPAAVYGKTIPACPRCGEYLEQPGFEYGMCDGCGSKYEFVQGAKPSLLPNRVQREAMDKIGRAWVRE
jgi:hypothetical protein